MLSRRQFLRFGVPLASGLITGLPFRGWADASGSTAPPVSDMGRYLIVNADDLGLGAGINRGIFESHTRGILTSASLMVTGRAVDEAVSEARNHPRLSIGLHVDLMRGGDTSTLLANLDAVTLEVEQQLDRFTQLVGRLPTHLDSHHHLHRRYNVAHVFLDASRRYSLPLRGFCDVVFYGGFWAKSPRGETDLGRVSVDALITLATGIGPGLSAISCHPGYYEPGVNDYGPPREAEVKALTDPRVGAALQGAAISLVSYLDYPRLSNTLAQARVQRRRREAAAARRRRPPAISPATAPDSK